MNAEEEEALKDEGNTIRTVSNFATTSDDGGTNSTIELLDPDVVNRKGRPRMLTIKEQIAQNKFYQCGHCGVMGHTIKSCPNLDRVYNLPKGKRTRKSKKIVEGEGGGILFAALYMQFF